MSLRDLADEVPKPQPVRRRIAAGGQSKPYDMEKFIQEQGLQTGPAIPYDGGYKWQMDCPFNPQHKSPDAYLMVTSAGAAIFKCSHNSCKGNDWKALKTHLGVPERPTGREPQRYTDKPPTPVEVDEVTGEIIQEGLPQILGTGRQLRDIATDALQAVLARNEPPILFSRGLKVVGLEESDKKTREIVERNPVDIRSRLARVADWYTETENGGEKPISPPIEVCQDLLAQGDARAQLPLLESIVYAPVVAPSGDICETPGYLPEAFAYYHSVDENPLPDSSPTPENVERAKDLIFGHLFHDFPFVDKASRAHALCLLLAPFVRPYIKSPTMMHLIDAPTRGTGKSLLAEVCGYVFKGSILTSFNPPARRNDDEWRKWLFGNLRAAPTIFWIDNVKQMLTSGALASAVTSLVFGDRTLGESKVESCPVRCIWVLTGNNTQMDDELPRRSLLIRLNTKYERPEDRNPDAFKVPDLREWVEAHRPELVAACLTLLRVWISKGRPNWKGKPVASFEHFSRVMGGILEANGVEGFLENREDLYRRTDSESDKWRDLVHKWWHEYDKRDVSTADLMRFAIDCEVVQEDSHGGRIAFGRLLKKAVDRVFEGYAICQSEEKHRAQYYHLERTTPIPADANLYLPSPGESLGDLELYSPDTHRNTHPVDTLSKTGRQNGVGEYSEYKTLPPTHTHTHIHTLREGIEKDSLYSPDTTDSTSTPSQNSDLSTGEYSGEYAENTHRDSPDTHKPVDTDGLDIRWQTGKSPDGTPFAAVHVRRVIDNGGLLTDLSGMGADRQAALTHLYKQTFDEKRLVKDADAKIRGYVLRERQTNRRGGSE